MVIGRQGRIGCGYERESVRTHGAVAHGRSWSRGEADALGRKEEGGEALGSLARLGFSGGAMANACRWWRRSATRPWYIYIDAGSVWVGTQISCERLTRISSHRVGLHAHPARDGELRGLS